jgi:hypothetical protein
MQNSNNNNNNTPPPLLSDGDDNDDDSMGFAEEELRHIDKSFNAFGGNNKEQTILNQIDKISQLQVKAFLNSMEIELKFPNVYIKSINDDFEEQDKFSQVNKAFQEKEKAISNLVKDLESISVGIDKINNQMNDDTTSSY